MPITPDDFDREPPAPPPRPMTATGLPIYTPPQRPAVPETSGVPGWIKVMAILAILFILMTLASNGVQQEEVTTDTAAVETIATDTMITDTMATDTMATDTVAIDTAVAMPSLQRGIRRYAPDRFRLHTWPSGPGAGAGIDMVLSSVVVREHETVVTFDISSDHHDVLLYEQLNLIVNGVATFDSIAGLEGGRQSSFVNRVRRIDIYAGEHVTLVARFPPLPYDATTLKFISREIDGWQGEWSWENINLRDGAVFADL